MICFVQVADENCLLIPGSLVRWTWCYPDCVADFVGENWKPPNLYSCVRCLAAGGCFAVDETVDAAGMTDDVAVELNCLLLRCCAGRLLSDWLGRLAAIS